MRKLLKSMKTLLVAAGLCVGANAWADVTPVSQDYSDATADWTSGNTGRYTVDMNAGGYLTVNAVSNGNNGTTITGTTVKDKAAAGEDFASSDDFTMIFDLQLTGANNGNPEASHKSSFYIYDATNSATTAILALNQTAGGSTEWKVNDAADQTVTLAKNTWYTFKLSKSGSKLYLTVSPTAGGDPVFAQQTITVKSSKGGVGNMIFNTDRYWAYMAIDNVVLRTVQDGDVPTGIATTYTIKYKNESDVAIKDDIVTDAFVDDVVTASAAQTAAITYNEQKYIYKSGNDNLTCVADAASNVITLVYREANTYTYKVTSSLGTELANSSNFEGETVSVPYPKYELDGTELKEATTTGTNTWYAYSYTLSANVDETITYNSVATPIENVVFYVEGENISGATASSANNANIRSSNAAVGYAAGTAGEDDITITTLPAGKYKIVANVFTSSSAGGTSTFKLGTNTFAATGSASSYNTLNTSEEFTIAEATDLILQAGGGATNAVDYVYVIKIGGANTLASGNAVNLTFNNATSGSNNWDNWIIDVYNGGNKVAKVRADWYDEVAGNNEAFTYGYTYSSDGGSTAENTNVWGSYVSDMANAAVDLTLSYTNGSLYIIGTAKNGNKVYYVNYTKSGLEGDVSYDLYGNNATLSNITTTEVSVLTTPAHPTNVAVALGTNGYATYANNVYPLDLTSAAAYKAAVDGDKVNFTLFGQAVPAGTGMLVEGEASGTVNLPIADESTTVTGNAFLVNANGTTFTAVDNTTYYAMIKDRNPLTFGKFDPSSLAFPATKAYLAVSATAAKSLTAIFGDDVTGISQVANAEAKGGNGIYNIAGQRVSQPTKGLYIIDGKKVVIK